MGLGERVRSVRATNELRLPRNEIDGFMTSIPDREWYGLEMAISQHPKGITYRQGGAVKDADGRIIGRDENEQLIKIPRSKATKATSHGFAKQNGSVDRRLDTPVDTGPGYHMVNRGRKVRGNSIRSLLS